MTVFFYQHNPPIKTVSLSSITNFADRLGQSVGEFI